MSLVFRNAQVIEDGDSRTLRASFDLENRSRRRQAEGDEVHLGWQLFDPHSGLFIAEGQWQPLAAAPPGTSSRREVEIQLPPEKGDYHVYVSPLRQETGWFYRSGSPFLLVEARVEGGRARLTGFRVTTLRRLVWTKRLGGAHKALTYPVLTVWRNFGLIRSLVRRDVAARYRGSFGDALWAVLNPLLLMLTYFFVFGIVLRARFGGDPSRTGFALYFLAGMLPWLPFAEAVGRSPFAVLEYRSFVKKLVFPIEIVPVNLAIAGLVTQAFALGAFLVFLLILRGGIPLTALWLPALIVPQLLLTVGLCWFLSALGVYVRDLGHVMGYLLTLWFFLTPICYPEGSLPPEALAILRKNPMFVLVAGFRDALLEGRAPAFGPLWKLWLLSIVVCILGHAWFYKLRKSFTDVL
ncbi:MAG: ABC transporter permease [Bryobacteraceae bacterium]|nr:ABC transporter permease [Bryobacteraceae bacterium]